MSTEIGIIDGQHESVKDGRKLQSKLAVTRFYGGAEQGRMLQLTILNSHNYIQLTKDDVRALIKLLWDAFDDKVNPSQ